jgi:hypothetical protein
MSEGVHLSLTTPEIGFENAAVAFLSAFSFALGGCLKTPDESVVEEGICQESEAGC